MNEKKRILGIDYGQRRIGIAITDPLLLFASPLVTLINDGKFWDQLLVVFSKYEIEKVVLGWPLKENGNLSYMTDEVEKFKIKLERKLKVPIVLFDERYSSVTAQNRIVETVSSRKKRREKGLIDRNAAAVILEEFLEHEKNIKN